jgi:hypothetical protein
VIVDGTSPGELQSENAGTAAGQPPGGASACQTRDEIASIVSIP